MSMLPMQRIYIYALKKDRKSILEMLQRREILEINDIVPEDNVFHKTDVSHIRSGLEKSIHAANDAIEILNHYAPEKKSLLSSFDGRKEVSVEEYSAFQDKYESTNRIINHVQAQARKVAESKAEILKLETQAEILEPWTNFDLSLGFHGTKYTKSFIGTLPKQWTLEELYQTLAEFMPIHIDIISSSKDQTCLFLLCRLDNAEALYDKLRSIEFSHPGITSDKAPAKQLEELNQRIAGERDAIRDAEQAIVDLAQYRKDILFLQDYDRMRADKYDVIGQLSQSKNVFVLTGYIPEKDVKNLEEELNRNYLVAVETEKPKEKEEVPVLLKNNRFSRPMEGVVSDFSLPSKTDIDPTTLTALFYYVLFGIMFADAGYGIIMIAACAYLLISKKSMEQSMKNFFTMFLYCGISTTFWGIMFGSYFGDLFDVIATTFFGATNTPLLPPVWFFPVKEPMRMLTFSMIMGLIHLLTGLIIKVYQLLRQKDYLAIIYDALSWFFLVISCTILLTGMDMIQKILGISVVVPAALNRVCAVTAVTAAVVIVLTNGRESRNIFKRLMKGAYALYGITNYLSDVLSYSRLLALGLASGIIGSVINKMAAMPAKGLLGPFVFVLIVIFGHILNMAINILGAYVHTIRLQYVEFYGKFYEGGGKAFEPFTMKTKYYKVKESVKHEI